MIYAFYFLAIPLIFLGYKSLRGGLDFLAYFKSELAKPPKNFTPFASIFVPCRGLDQGLEKNLAALFVQDYPAYEIIFVVDSEKDVAIQIIDAVYQQFSAQLTTEKRKVVSKLGIAGKTETESQKVHNLISAIEEVHALSEVFVFVDSDARPNPNWLRDLVSPLENVAIGASTGYRWFVPLRGGFSSQLRSVWNASIASQLGANMHKNFVWGGSMAIRRKVFDKIQMLEKWRGTASDDFALTRALQAEKLPIYFVPQCLTASIEDSNFRELLEFTTRQMKITRVYAQHLWKASFVGSFFFTFVFWLGILVTIIQSILGNSIIIASVLLLIIFVLGAAKAWLRLKAVKLVLPKYLPELSGSLLPQLTLWTISPAIYFYNSLQAWRSRRIVWRGVAYELISPNETKIFHYKN